ncbi:hypothetical protein EJ08DRAFT_690169 [Tothia fuscella]|uniref:Zn(2)-C6 fungal-type domain-containing protein n=1 Tax=Tothia fuscella TaxID=1048955 RepID=A0A9P4TT14_9PEZI|nr:hypothetical protein EJ08DRAFT_690169 [Tothia fuscella]
MDPALEINAVNPGQQNVTDPEPFRCKICSKAFTKRPSRNRHVLYCRKKFGEDHSVVRKSCAACRKAKVKCSSEFPRCCRCVDRDVICVYELTRRSRDLDLQPVSPPLNKPIFDDAMLLEPSNPRDQNYSSWDTPPSCNNEALLNPNATQSGASPVAPEPLDQDTVFEWEPDVGVGEVLEESHVGTNLYSNGIGDEFPLDWFFSTPLPGLTLESTVTIPADCMFHTPYLVLRPIDFHYPFHSTSLIAPRSPFIPSRFSSGSQNGRTFLLQNIQSYATLLSNSSLPPFIHPNSLPRQGPCLPSSAPLEICNSFIWRAITMEKDRLMEELEDADEWTTLSMLQAITLYCLLGIFDGDSFSVDFDHELVRAMIKIAIKAEQRQLLCPAEVEGWRPKWKDWVLLESKRRTPEQRGKAYVGLSVLPLPAHKQLWEATGEEDRKQRYDEMLRARKGLSYLRYEDLRDLGKGKVTGGRMEDLNAWMVSGDAFGMLVMMAATAL